MPRRPPTLALLLGLLFAAGSAGASPEAAATGSAHVVAVRVVVPGQDVVVAGVTSAPPDAALPSGAFAFPADGSAVSVAAIAGNASASRGKAASAAASTDLTSVSLFGGEVTVGTVAARATATASATAAAGDFSGAALTGLVALGSAVAAPTAGMRIPLADWGYADVLAQATVPTSGTGVPAYRGSLTALAVHLTAAHGGLPAGSEVLIGYVDAAARGPEPAPPPTTTAPPPTTTAPPPKPVPTPQPKPTRPAAKAARKAGGRPDPPQPKRRKVPLRPPEAPESAPGPPLPVIHDAPLAVTPKLTAGRYVFPVYGPSSFTDTFGAPRAAVGWHHGEDIFAPLGAPILACADGTVHSVGWNHLGGYRLWLRDGQGNEFYYAHLSAYAPGAVNGRRVAAGTVLGFIGNTGDAVGTPYHLHFEIHPASLLHRGYDGAVNPNPYLGAWKRLEDVRISPLLGWAPPLGRPKKGTRPAPAPGAILLQATDISTASGLDPASLERVLAPIAAEGDGLLVGGAEAPPSGPYPVRGA
jgi:murein DD-endopeptidase MepM/ murein hydrolase activator NlpD